MKTVMQEFIDALDNQINSLSDKFIGIKIHLIIVRNNAISKLPKEKEQIIDAYTAACEMNYGDIDSDVIDLKGEEYYNQTCNQNIDLKQVAEKLRDRKELFPEANQRVKDMLNKQNK
jgi:hypothetical protein